MLNLLMITHNRLDYLKKALPSVLNQTFKDFRLYIWDNGSDNQTTDWLKSQKNLNIHFNKENESLADVTTKSFKGFSTEFVGKVDSDVIIPPDWIERLIGAHQKHHFGFIGGFHFMPEDLSGINPNIENFDGVDIWRKHHIGGNYIIRREDFKGYSGTGVHGLSEYQAEMGLVNGYLWNPILWIEHMEDFRSPHYIENDEYNQYKLRTRGISLADYPQFTDHTAYLRENTHE